MPDLEDRIMKRSRLVITQSAAVLHDAEGTLGHCKVKIELAQERQNCDVAL